MIESLAKPQKEIVTDQQRELEQNLLTKKGYRLTKSDVSDILLGQHIEKYKQFIFSWYQAVASRFWTCLYRTLSRKKQKFVLLYQEGESRIDNALDVRQIIETHESVHLLKKLLLSQQSRTLFRLQRDKLLEFGGSESDLSPACSMDIDALRTQSDKREDFI